jgi:hypothetical protein
MAADRPGGVVVCRVANDMAVLECLPCNPYVRYPGHLTREGRAKFRDNEEKCDRPEVH